MRKIVVIAHNLRSIHNVGSLLRTAEGLGIEEVFLTGYSPYPNQKDDARLPHQITKINSQISKTALGAEIILGKHADDIFELINHLKAERYIISALEQDDRSIELNSYDPPDKVALIIGREVEGIEKEILDQCDSILQIPMFGQKESFNVVQAAAMALYKLRFSK